MISWVVPKTELVAKLCLNPLAAEHFRCARTTPLSLGVLSWVDSLYLPPHHCRQEGAWQKLFSPCLNLTISSLEQLQMPSSCTHKTDLVSSLGSHPAWLNWNTLEDNTQVTQAADVPSSRWACRQWRITRTSLSGLEGTQRWGSGSTRQMREVGEDQTADLGVFPRWVPETPGFLPDFFTAAAHHQQQALQHLIIAFEFSYGYWRGREEKE